MITTVGKKSLLFAFLGIASFIFPATIQLKLTTLEGETLQQAGIGQPFLLNVVVTDTSNSAQYPTIKGIENLHIRQSGFQMNMVNGKTSVTYHYRVRIDTPGEYTLGPAQIKEGADTLQSDPLSVMVGDEQKSSGRRNQKATQAPVLKLTCNKTEVYVGQTISAQLAFYTADATTALQSITEPETTPAQGLVFKNKQNQPLTGTQKINGIDYRFAQWNFQIVPTKAGTLVVPAYFAQYTSQANQPMLSFFFHNDIKRAQSNTLILEVQSLPPSQRAPLCIGTLQNVRAQSNPTHARVGQGIVYSLIFQGDTDFDAMPMPALVMNNDCKWYESKKYYAPEANGKNNFVMEYIVQALQPGTIIIPPQEIYYFDTTAKRYKTISTNPISLEITGTAAPEQSEIPLSNEQAAPNQVEQSLPLMHEGPIEQRSIPALPWPLFWSLIGLATLLWLACVLFSMNKNLFGNLVSLFKKPTSPYDAARRSITYAYEKKDYSAYYRQFNQLFAARLNIEQVQLTPELIENSLRQDGLSAQAIEDWKNFYAEISQMSFYKTELDQTYYQQITQKSYYWIDVLKQLPRVHL